MKYLPVFSVAAALAIVGCESMTAPLTTSGTFDPLAPAGGVSRPGSTTAAASFKPGQFVRATIDNTAFFTKRPKGDADADKLLPRNTQMKVISSDPSYLKVELDSGEIGFVPSVMVHDPNAPVEGLAGDSGHAGYPPFSDGGAPIEPLPELNPSSMPADGVPPVIAPLPNDPVTPLPSDAIPSGPETPPAAPETAPPLPPGGEDVTGSSPAPAPAPQPEPAAPAAE